eukprot:2399729-Rhodomonas_salina.2
MDFARESAGGECTISTCTGSCPRTLPSSLLAQSPRLTRTRAGGFAHQHAHARALMHTRGHSPGWSPGPP